MNWKETFEKAYKTASQQYNNGKTGASIDTMQNCIDRIFSHIRHNIQDENEQTNVAKEFTAEITEVCKELHEVSIRDWKEYARSIPKDGSRESDEMIKENNHLITNVEIAISQMSASIGFNLIEIFGDVCDLGKEGISMIDKAIYMIKHLQCSSWAYGAKSDERNEIIARYHVRSLKIKQETYKRRLNEYWDAHQQEKANLESEKQSLNDQITDLNNEILAIPQNTDGYADMVELQKKVKSLISEKRAIGFFKFKDKKAVQVQIDSTNSEIAPIQTRINSAIEAVQKNISSLKCRIDAIENELTMPR